MPDPTKLSEENRTKLDGIVQKMTSNNESEDNINFVVNDFKSKYLEKKNPIVKSTSQNQDVASGTSTGSSDGINPAFKSNIPSPIPSFSPTQIKAESRKSIINKIRPLADKATTITNEDNKSTEADYNQALNGGGFIQGLKEGFSNTVNNITGVLSKVADVHPDDEKSLKVKVDAPLKHIQDEVVNEAIKNKESITPAQTAERVKAKFIDKRNFEIRQSRLNELNSNLSDSERADLKDYSEKSISHLGKENKDILKSLPTLKGLRDDSLTSLENFKSQISEFQNNNQTIPDDLINQYKDTYAKVVKYDSDLNTSYSKFTNNRKDIGTAQQEFDVYKTEAGNIHNFVQRVDNAVIHFGAGALDFIGYLGGALGEDQASDGMHELASKTRKIAQTSEEYLRKTSTVENFKDLINITTDFVATNSPMVIGLTASGGAGLAGMTATATGDKWGEMKDEEAKGDASYSKTQKILAPMAYGAAMIAPMARQLGTIKNSVRVLEAIAKESPELIESTLRQKASDYITKSGVKFASDSFKLGNELKLMEVLQEGVNHFGLGKDFDYKKISDLGVYKTAPLLHVMNTVSAHLLVKVVEPFMTKDETKQLDNNSKVLFDLHTKLNDNSLSPEEITITKNTIDNISKQSRDLVKGKIKSVTDTPQVVTDAIIDATQKSSDYRGDAIRIQASDKFTPEQKKVMLADLKIKYSENESHRVDLISGTKTAFDLLSGNEQAERLNKAGKEIMKDKNPDGTKNVTVKDEESKKLASDKYEKELSDKKIEDDKQAEQKLADEQNSPTPESQLQVEAEKIEEKRKRELDANKKATELNIGIGGEKQVENEINAKYDAELEALKLKTEKVAEPVSEDVVTPSVETDISKKTIDDLEKRQAEIEGNKQHSEEFNKIDKELEKREWQSVMLSPLSDVKSVLENLEQKEKTMPNGFGSYIEKRDIRESKGIVDKYQGEVSKDEAANDFKDAFFGKPSTWYADGLKLKESVRVFMEKGGTFKELLQSVQKEFEADGFTEQDAASVINRKLSEITKVNEATPTADITPDGNIRLESTNVAESGIAKQESPKAESIPSTVDGGEVKGDAKVGKDNYEIEPYYKLKPKLSKEDLDNFDDISDAIIIGDSKDLPKGYSLKTMKSYRENGINYVEVEVTNPKGDKFYLRENTFELRDLDHAKDQIEKGVLQWNGNPSTERVNLGISWADIRKGESDIAKGKTETVPAKRLVEALKNAKEKGGYEYVQGRGGQNHKQFVTLDDIQRTSNEHGLTDAEQKHVDAHEVRLAKEHEEYFNKLDEQTQNDILDNYENREQKNNSGEIQSDSPIRESKNDVPNQESGKEPKPQEQEVKDLGTKARDLAKEYRSGKNVLPDWLRQDEAKGSKTNGINLNEAFANALDAFADVHDATKDLAKAVNEGFKHIKDWYDKNGSELNEEALNNLKSKFQNHVESTIRDKEQSVPEKESLRVGVNNESMKKVADALGLDAPIPGEGWNSEDAVKTGRALLDVGAKIDPIIEKTKNGEMLTPEEFSVARAHFEDLTKDVNEGYKKGIDSKEYKEAKDRADKFYSDIIAPAKTKWSKTGHAMQGETDIYDGSFYKLEKEFKKQLKADNLTPEQTKLVEKLANDILKSKAELEDNYNKITKAKEELAKIHEEGKASKEVKTSKGKAKELATEIRKFKIHRPDIFSAANPASIVWDGAVETIAKIVENGGILADAIDKGLEHIKNSQWYKGLDKVKKQEAIDAFNNSYSKINENKISSEKEVFSEEESYQKEVETKIKGLQKQLDDVNSGKVKDTEGKSSIWSKEISDLKAEIKDSKYKQSLVKLTTSLQGKTDNKFDPSQARDIWKYAKETYLDKGEEYPEMICKVSEDLGLDAKQVINAIAMPKSSKITTREMYEKQKKNLQTISLAKETLKDIKKGKIQTTIEKIPNAMRELKVYGHGGVGFMTHLMGAIKRPSEYKFTKQMFFDQYRLMYNKGKYQDYYENSKTELLAHPNYHFWKMNGLDIDPTYRDTGYEVGKGSNMGERAFFALKLVRLAQAENAYNKLPEIVKSDPATARNIAAEYNYSSGSSKYKTAEGRITKRGDLGSMEGITNTMLFAKSLTVAKYQHAILNPIRAMGILSNSRSTVGEKAIAKITLKRQAESFLVHAGALAANAAILSLMGSKNTPNVTDPTKPDFLCLQLLDGSYIPLTKGNDSTYKLLLTLAKLGKDYHSGDKDKRTVASSLETQGRYMLSPFSGTAFDIALAKDAMGNPLEFLGGKSKFKRGMGVLEYMLRDQTPIPVGEAISHYYKEHYDEHREDLGQISFEGFLHGVLAGGFGTNKYKKVEDKKKSSGMSLSLGMKLN